jgi:hypothetical protein
VFIVGSNKKPSRTFFPVFCAGKLLANGFGVFKGRVRRKLRWVMSVIKKISFVGSI